jgi:uncharacterized low-complexity protein
MARLAVIAAVASALALAAVGCAYVPKTENSVDVTGEGVRSTATVRTTTPQRPLEND